MAVKIKWNRGAFEEIRRTSEVDGVLRAEVDRVLDQVGDHDGVDYVGGVEPGASRSRGYVVTASADAIEEEAETHALLRALTSGSSL